MNRNFTHKTGNIIYEITFSISNLFRLYKFPHVIIHWEKTQAFLNNYNAKRGLDIGDRTPFTDQLESFFNCPLENTTFDLDEGKLEWKYDIITVIEIIEHLFNPLHLLTEIAGILKDGGKFYLSTPKGKTFFYGVKIIFMR